METPRTCITEVYVSNEEGFPSLSPKEKPGSKRHYAKWLVPTVGLWWEHQRHSNPAEQEKKAWEILLLDTSLTKVSREDGSLSKDSFRRIMEFRPGKIASFLVKKLLEKTIFTHQESVVISRDAMLLWSSEISAPKGHKIHPSLEKVSLSMALWDNYGIKVLPDYNDLTTYEFQCLTHGLSCYHDVQNSKHQAAMLKAEANRKARGH